MSAFKRHKFSVVLVLFIIVIVIISSFVYLNYLRPKSGVVGSITIGLPFSEASSLVIIADDRQYFSANGLKVTLKNYPTGLDAVKGMLGGESDISAAAEFVFAEQVLQNASIFAIGNVCQYLSIYVVGRTDKGIITPSDLNGKIIGVALGTSHQFFLGQFLELNGLNASQVRILNVPLNQQSDALANGTIDAVVTTPPYLGQIESNLGNKLVVWSAQAGQSGYGGVICTKSWATAHPDLIVRFLKALVQAEAFIINNSNQAIAIVAERMNYTIPYLASIWTEYRFSVTLDQSFILLVEDEAQWLIANNLTNATSVPNILSDVQTDGLTVVKPQAVNIVGGD